MKKSCEAAPLIVIVLFIVGGCGGGGGKDPSGHDGEGIVRIGDIVLTEHELDNLLPAGERIPFTTDEKRRTVQRWVDNEILYQEAVRRGLKRDPRIVARLRGLEQELLANHLLFIELSERTRVSDAEIEEYFGSHRQEYLYEYRVSHILVNTYEEAEEVQELLKNRSFSWVANRHSLDPVAKRGGDLGYLTKGNMIPAFEEVIFDMKAGEVSDIIHSEFGYHIIKLVGMREALVKVSLDDVREQIMNKLMIERRTRAYAEFMRDLRAVADIEYLESEYALVPFGGAVGDSLAAGDSLALEDSIAVEEHMIMGESGSVYPDTTGGKSFE
ncbi:MAG: peptidylprolyl isomerase [bacterium]|nr:MAG: peptidylprolyl isomerase [bacterium]